MQGKYRGGKAMSSHYEYNLQRRRPECSLKLPARPIERERRRQKSEDAFDKCCPLSRGGRAAICGNRGREYLKANDEGRGREISEAFGLAECEIVSGEKDFGDWHSCVARASRQAS